MFKVTKQIVDDKNHLWYEIEDENGNISKIDSESVDVSFNKEYSSTTVRIGE